MMSFHGVPCLRRYVPGLMLRSPPVARAYTRNILRHPTRFALDSESAASAKLAPLGMITRVDAPYGFCPHAASTKHPAANAARSSVRNIEGVLQKNRRGERVNVAFPTACGFSHLSYCTQCCRRSESFIIKTNGHATTFRDFCPQSPHFGGPIGLVALSVERKAQNEPYGLQLRSAREDLCDRWPLAFAPRNEPRRRGD